MQQSCSNLLSLIIFFLVMKKYETMFKRSSHFLPFISLSLSRLLSISGSNQFFSSSSSFSSPANNLIKRVTMADNKLACLIVENIFSQV
jgi:hypothetical protein